jgi:hypothetical protein
MEIKDLVNIEYSGWYVESCYDNKIILRSNHTVDHLSEIYIKLQGDNFVTVSYSSSHGDGVFFHAANLTPEEISKRLTMAADEHFDYE